MKKKSKSKPQKRSKNNKWIQKAFEKIKKRGTAGKFREFCGGKVTIECIEEGVKSKSPIIRKRANFMKNVFKARAKKKTLKNKK